MGVQHVQRNAQQATSDGYVSTDEARKIVSREDGVFSAPESVGTFMNRAEHAVIADVYQRIERGSLRADPQARSILKQAVERGPDKRWKHALKGGPLGRKLALAGGLTVGGFFTYMGFALVGFPAGLAIGAQFAAMGAAAGYLLGVVQALFDD